METDGPTNASEEGSEQVERERQPGPQLPAHAHGAITPLESTLRRLAERLLPWQQQFWFAAAGGVVAGGVVAACLVLSNDFSQARHPGHYSTFGRAVLLGVCQFFLIVFVFVPLDEMRRSQMAEEWVTNVTSGILATFVLANGVAALGAIRGLAFQWPSFLLQSVVILFVVGLATGRFEQWSHEAFGDISVIAWVGYAVYCLGLGGVLYGSLKLGGVASTIVIIVGAVGMLIGALAAESGANATAGEQILAASDFAHRRQRDAGRRHRR